MNRNRIRIVMIEYMNEEVKDWNRIRRIRMSVVIIEYMNKNRTRRR